MSSSHKVCFSLLLLKAIITFTTLGIPSNIRKSVVVNGDKKYTVYTFSCFPVYNVPSYKIIPLVKGPYSGPKYRYEPIYNVYKGGLSSLFDFWS